jgi:cyclic pyranopterin phosphate synthase
MAGKLTHIDQDGRAKMVDVSDKASTKRVAVATGRVVMSKEALELARSKGGKGDVRATAEIAGVMAAKRTSDLIPMCHPLALSNVKVRVDESEDGSGLAVVTEVATTGPTGVEMEALTAAAVACLTIYDMLKAADKAMTLEGIRLVEKTGGRSGTYRASDQAKR